MEKKKLWIKVGVGACVAGVVALGCYLSSQKEVEEAVMESFKEEEKVIQPIKPGWCVSESVKGEQLSEEQKRVIDQYVEEWKECLYRDDELQAAITSYLLSEEIECSEVSVVSNSYTIRAEVPEVELSEDGGLYQFIGIYSSGDMNLASESGTECSQWSIFIF